MRKTTALLSLVAALTLVDLSPAQVQRGSPRSGGTRSAPRSVPRSTPRPAPVQRSAPRTVAPPTRTFSPPRSVAPPTRTYTPPRTISPPTRTYTSPRTSPRRTYTPPQGSDRTTPTTPSRGRSFTVPSPGSTRVYRLPGNAVTPGGPGTPPTTRRYATPPTRTDNRQRYLPPTRRDTGAVQQPQPAPTVRSRPRLSTGFPSRGSVGDSGSSNRTSLRDLYRRGRSDQTVPPVSGRSGAKVDLGRYRRDAGSGATAPKPGVVGRRTTAPIAKNPAVGRPAPTPRTGAPRRSAGDRYGIPGGAPIAQPIRRTPTVIAPIAKRRVVTTPVAGASRRLVQAQRPRLSAPRAGAASTALRSDRVFHRYNNAWGRSYRSRHRSFYGGLHSYNYGVNLRFCFGFGLGFGYGLYGYPYYYGCYYPGFYYNSCYDYIGGYYPAFSSCWWWPRSYCYTPIVYNTYYGGGYDAGSYVTTAYGGTSYDSATRVSAGARSPAAKEALAQKHVRLGDFYFKEGRFKEAAESYQQALSLTPDDATIHFVLADALFAIGDYHQAAFMIGEGLRLDPELAASEADKRTFYGDARLFDEQLATLRAYVASKPYDAAAHLVLGYNLKFSERKEEALASFRRVLEIEPSNAPAKAFADAMAVPAEADKTPAADPKADSDREGKV